MVDVFCLAISRPSCYRRSMPQIDRSLAQRIFIPVTALGAFTLACFDKFSGSGIFGDTASLISVLSTGAATLGNFMLNISASKAWQDHTDREKQNAIAAAILENGDITRHVGKLLAALVTDAGGISGLQNTAGTLAAAIPEAWERIVQENPEVRRRLEGPEYARDLLSHLARSADVPVLDAEDIVFLFETIAADCPDLDADHVTRLAHTVAARLARAVADGLTSPHPDADRAFRRALLNCHAETFAAVRESLDLAKVADSRLAQLVESFDVFTDTYCRNVEGFAEILTQVAEHMTRMAGDVTRIRTVVTDTSGEMRRLTALVGRMHDMQVRIFQRQTRDTSGEFAAQFVEAYRQRLVQSFSGWEEVEAPVYAEGDAAARRKPATIRDIFVAPACAEQRDLVHPDAFHRLHGEKKHPVAALIPLLATEDYRRTVLLADPGFGKTTLLQYLIVTLAGRGELPLGAEALEESIPIPLVVRDIVRFLPEDIRQWRSWRRVLEAFRMARGPQDAGGFEPLTSAFAGASGEAAFRALLADPRAIFLVDGLDEIGDPDRRGALASHLAHRWL